MPLFSMTLFRCYHQFTFFFLTRMLRALFTCQMKKQESVLCSNKKEKKKGFFLPATYKVSVFFLISLNVIRINPKRLGPNFQITFCYTGNVSVQSQVQNTKVM